MNNLLKALLCCCKTKCLPKTGIVSILLFAFLQAPVVAADDIPTSGITAGVLQGKYLFAEAGYSYGVKIYWPKSSQIKGYGAFTLGAEGGYSEGRFVAAPKITFTMNLFVSFGASIVYYTDFNLGGMRFRPEIGIGTLGLRLMYGRNITMANYEFPGINVDNLMISVYLPVFDSK